MGAGPAALQRQLRRDVRRHQRRPPARAAPGRPDDGPAHQYPAGACHSARRRRCRGVAAGDPEELRRRPAVRVQPAGADQAVDRRRRAAAVPQPRRLRQLLAGLGLRCPRAVVVDPAPRNGREDQPAAGADGHPGPPADAAGPRPPRAVHRRCGRRDPRLLPSDPRRAGRARPHRRGRRRDATGARRARSGGGIPGRRSDAARARRAAGGSDARRPRRRDGRQVLPVRGAAGPGSAGRCGTRGARRRPRARRRGLRRAVAGHGDRPPRRAVRRSGLPAAGPVAAGRAAGLHGGRRRRRRGARTTRRRRPSLRGRRAARASAGRASGRAGRLDATGGRRSRRGVRHVHVGFDRPAQGRRHHPSGDRQPSTVDAGRVRADRRRPGATEDAVRLRRLGVGVLLAADHRGDDGRGRAGGSPGRRVPRRDDQAPRRHHRPLRAVDAPSLRGRARRDAACRRCAA